MTAHRMGTAIGSIVLAVAALYAPASAASDDRPPVPSVPRPSHPFMDCLRGEAVTGCQTWGTPHRLGRSRIGPLPITDGTTSSAGSTNAALGRDRGCSVTVPVPGDEWCERWVALLDPVAGDQLQSPIALRVAPSGSEVYVLTQMAWPLGPPRIVVLDADTGAALRTVALATGIADATAFYPRGLEVSPDGTTLFVTGTVCGRTETSEGFTSYANYLTVAYSPSGEALWRSRYAGPVLGSCGGPRGDHPLDVEVSPDGATVYVTGLSTGTGESVEGVPPYDVVTIAYDASTGANSWTERFDTGAPELGQQLAVGQDGSVYVSTMSWLGESSVLAYRGLGGGPVDLAWVHQEELEDFGWPVGIEVTPAGDRVVLGGISTTGERVKYAALALTAEGERSWRTTYSHVFKIGVDDYIWFDLPLAIAVDRDRLYVTGLALEWDVLNASGAQYPPVVDSTVAFDLDTGRKSWNEVYRFPGERLHMPSSIDVSGDAVFVSMIASECNFLFGPPNLCEPRSVTMVNLGYDSDTGDASRIARYNHGRGLFNAAGNASAAIGPGFNWAYRSAAGPDETLYVSAVVENRPCIEYCYGTNYGLALFGY